jgi:hypothetical protein
VKSAELHQLLLLVLMLMLLLVRLCTLPTAADTNSGPTA